MAQGWEPTHRYMAHPKFSHSVSACFSHILRCLRSWIQHVLAPWLALPLTGRKTWCLSVWTFLFAMKLQFHGKLWLTPFWGALFSGKPNCHPAKNNLSFWQHSPWRAAFWWGLERSNDIRGVSHLWQDVDLAPSYILCFEWVQLISLHIRIADNYMRGPWVFTNNYIVYSWGCTLQLINMDMQKPWFPKRNHLRFFYI
jgi:hypothetical protein